MLDDDIKMIPVIDKKKTLVDVITRTNIPERKQRLFYSRGKALLELALAVEDLTHQLILINITVL